MPSFPGGGFHAKVSETANAVPRYARQPSCATIKCANDPSNQSTVYMATHASSTTSCEVAALPRPSAQSLIAQTTGGVACLAHRVPEFGGILLFAVPQGADSETSA